MKIIDPKDLNIIQSLPPVSVKGDKVSVDSEFFKQVKGRLHRAHGDFAGMGVSYDGVTIYYTIDEKDIPEFMSRIDKAVHIYHHAKYDITQLRRFAHIPQRNLLWDTMLIEQIMYSGYYKDFGLNDLARRYLDVYMAKDVRDEFETSDTMSKEQIEYMAVDIVATWRVYKEQRKIIDETDLMIWKDIELPFLWTILGMSGIRLDVQKWLDLAEYNKNTANNIQEKYGDLNLASPAQVKKHLHSLGYKLDSTGVGELEAIVDECEFARDLLLFRGSAKRSSTYGAKFVEDFVEDDGCVYSDIYQIGAETARTSSRNPNVQNQPHEGKYRECFIADPNECLIVADWSSQEPRIAAYMAQDEKLIAVFGSGKDIYIEIAKDVLGETITKSDPRRKQIKALVLGIFYGMSAYGLGDRLGIGKEEAQDMIDTFLHCYPGVQDYMMKQQKAGQFVTSIYGRKIWLNKYDYQWERNALNAPIQASAAEAMKIAAYRYTCEVDGDDFYTNIHLKLLVHDEMVSGSENEKCDKTSQILRKCMIEVAEEMHDGITASLEIFIGQNWSCKQ